MPKSVKWLYRVKKGTGCPEENKGEIKMDLEIEAYNEKKRENLLIRIEEGLEDVIYIREYYKDDEYESLVEDSVEDTLVEKYGLEDTDILKLVSRLSDVVFAKYPTG